MDRRGEADYSQAAGAEARSDQSADTTAHTSMAEGNHLLMDIVRRAYFQARGGLPSDAAISALHEDMVRLMVRWIKLKAYSKGDWPTRELGPYPVHLEKEVE